jgi:acetyl-CoA decarbonylase/synthase complex subunit gamma
MEAALEHCGAGRPLLYGATAANFDAVVALAQKWDCPLALRAGGLSELVTLSERAAQAGFAQLLLDSGAQSPAQLLNDQTVIRRAALNKKFKPLGFPTVAVCSAEDPAAQMLEACTAVAKYVGVVILDPLPDEYLLPIVTARLNIYSDPQKPIQVEPGVHEVGEPTPESPVLVTTNFSLTYYLVEGDVMASKMPAHVLAVDTEGTSVLTAWAAGNFSAESIAEAMNKFALAEKVAHRALVLPGGVAVLKGKLEELSGWEVLVGPRESSGIPLFFRQRGWVPR